MVVPMLGRLTVGWVLVLANFGLTFAVALAYRWYAEHRLDPPASREGRSLDDRSWLPPDPALAGGELGP
jgi:hypothetical protein